MNKVIVRNIQVSEKAIKIAEISCGYCSTHCCTTEELYLSERKEFFLIGKGGPGSMYGVKVGKDSYRSGQAIITLTREEALDWYLDRSQAVLSFKWCLERDRTEALKEWFSDLVGED